MICSVRVALLSALLAVPLVTRAEDGPATDVKPAATKPDAEAAYTASIQNRAVAHTKPLKLEDAKNQRVQQTIVDQYRALRDWHAANDATVKDLKKKVGSESDAEKKAALQADLDKAEASLRTLHSDFLNKLGQDLSPEQIDVIKDQMTYNVRNVTYKAFNEMLPNLKDEEKAEIMKQLTEARELAMDAGSSDEKHAVFGKYKGRINIYLGKQGYDLKAASKAFNEKIKADQAAKKNGATTKPADEAAAN